MLTKDNPNVIIIYADDLGFGDLSCYGAEDINTPNIDRLAESGVRLTNSYSASAVCTPARYSLLTGEYPFRNPKTYILPGDAACIISKKQETLPKVFKRAGYRTGVVGKWHLGLGDGSLDWNKPITHTPNDVGFDDCFVFPATNDRVPCVYVENGTVRNLEKDDPIQVSYTADCPYDDIDTYKKNPEKLRMFSSHGHDKSIINGVGRIGYMKGGETALWKDEDLAETFLNRAKGFVDQSGEQPFFLFYALHQPHVPRLPSERFKGVSKLGARGDVIAELDWCVGELVNHLKQAGILENTIIIFSSDNGPVLDDGYKDDALSLNNAHSPAGPLRGGKYSRFEGGARIPLIVSRVGHTQSCTSDALISQVDFLASFAAMIGVSVEENTAADSQNMLETLLGNTKKGRDEILFEGGNKAFSIRMGKWTYIQPSGGAKVDTYTKTELANTLDSQLYNMDYDAGQRENVAEFYPEVVKKLDLRLKEIVRKE